MALSCEFQKNAELSRKIAADGMVLLKNEAETLPLENNIRIALFGRGQIDFIKGGTGSADVCSAYTVNLLDGMSEKEAEGKIIVDHAVSRCWKESPEFTASSEFISEAAVRNDVALITISRNSGEGCDRKCIPGEFLLSDSERELIDRLEKSAFKRIVVVVNAGALIDLAWAAKNPRISAILYAWQAGMEGGRAAADVLCGNINPSGKLADTFAEHYENYPSADTFCRYRRMIPYEDDIFVGYRYFETIPGAKEKVIYPFGFGLSYTAFEYRDIHFKSGTSNITVTCKVVNTGRRCGREIVQVYSASPAGKLEKPALELRAYAKTCLLAPEEEETLKFTFPTSSLASFDDSGLTGHIGAYLLEPGNYKIMIGGSIRSLFPAGNLAVPELRVVETTGLKLTAGVSRILRADGRFDVTGIVDNSEPRASNRAVSSFIDGIGENYHLKKDAEQDKSEKVIKLIEVAEGRASMAEFMRQLTKEELVGLCQAQPPAFPRGTAGVGNIRKYGVPSPQTADGPAGLRKSVPTTCFPCTTLIACTWDEKLQFEMGRAIGFEGVTTGVDILLAPGLNIHRNPLCGRNFEYYSEDPLVSGKSAAAFVRGVQTEGMGATIKHFAANNREEDRLHYDSIVSERALREIYLKGFEIAVKEGKPWCVMSSYNLLNGSKTSTNYNLLTRILREEWGFDGAVMTDWRNNTHLWEEILAGNDIKMPFGYPEEIDMAVEYVNWLLPLPILERSVRRVLELVMKTGKFKKQDFGISHRIASSGITRIKAIEMTAVSCTWTQAEPCQDIDGGFNHTRLGKDQRGNDTYLIYNLEIEKAGCYEFSIRVATIFDTSHLEFALDNCPTGKLQIRATGDGQIWSTQGPVKLDLAAGEHIFNIYIRDQECNHGVNINWFEFKSMNS